MLGFNKKTQDASPQENTGGENKVFHFIKTHKKRCIAVVAAAAVLVAVIVPRRSRSASADLAYTQEKLGRRDIVNVYDGSGTINAADSYTVKSLVTGTVLTADFELGDSIEKGDILYTIDISDVETTSRAHSSRWSRHSAITMTLRICRTSAPGSAARSAPLQSPQATPCRLVRLWPPSATPP